ncbi:MAG: aryl-sulfate sulfotransferase, partial [Terracidiphilus sp.]
MRTSPAPGRGPVRRLSITSQPFLAIPALSLLLFFLAGCSNVVITGDPNPPKPPAPPPPPTPVTTGTITITPTVAAVAPGQNFQFSASNSKGGTIQWSVSGGSIDQTGNYTAPASISQSENVTVTAALAANTQIYATAIVSIIQPGQIACPTLTGNPQVAQYTVYLPAPGTASVQFGTTTSYGLNTWQVPTPTTNGANTGGQVQLWVAGMLGNTTYHMRGHVVLQDGAVFNDADQTCATGKPPITPAIKITANGTPQPGIEMWNTVNPPTFTTQAFATDLQGNVIWTYAYTHSTNDIVQGVQLLPNGDLIMTISFLSSVDFPPTQNLINEVREIDLAGNTVRSLNMTELNQKLLATPSLHDAQGNPYQFKSFHHDVLVLPNGHWVVLTCYSKGYSNVAGESGNVAVLGDAIVDVDQNNNPDWVWNTFDGLAKECGPPGVCGVNRHPMNFPDWTHSNDMLYSSDDHNLLLSIRHQNWVVKINFQDGTGSGDVMWKLGYQGDFKLVDATDPTDWFYAQHGMNYLTANTTGDFKLTMMDNGNDRTYPSGQVFCNPFAPPLPTSCYSTVPVLEINESNMTATMLSHYEPGPNDFSYFGGNAAQLANGDFEIDFAVAKTTNGGLVQELTPGAWQPVWQATTSDADQYHVNRWPSLYPG